jgi:hypothetical protein
LSDPSLATGWVPSWPQDSTPGGYTPWGDFTLSGVYSMEEYLALNMPRFFLTSDPTELVQYVDVQVRDSASDTVLQIGCFGVSETYTPEIGIGYGWQVTPIDESDIQSVPFGSTTIVSRGMRRRLNLGLPGVREDEAWLKTFGLVLYKGKSQPVVVIPLPDDTAHLERRGLYGLQSQDGALANPFFETYAQNLQFDELR